MPFGTGPYGVGAFGLPLAGTATPTQVQVVTSQAIDAKAMDYVVYDDGNYVGMDDTMQRILLLISFNVKRPALIGVGYEANMREQVLAALAPLLKSTPPTISIEELNIDTSGDASYIHLRYKNNITGKSSTATAPV